MSMFLLRKQLLYGYDHLNMLRKAYLEGLSAPCDEVA